MEKITTHLWFDSEAEEAARFYVSLFPDSRVLAVTYYAEGMPRPAGSVMTVHFRLAGREFVALNGGPQFPFTEAISLAVRCEDQAEVDRLWDRLSEGGEPGPCGWLKDRWGLSWQVVPAELAAMMSDPDPARAQAVGQALLQMGKLDVARLREAYEQAAAG